MSQQITYHSVIFRGCTPPSPVFPFQFFSKYCVKIQYTVKSIHWNVLSIADTCTYKYIIFYYFYRKRLKIIYTFVLKNSTHFFWDKKAHIILFENLHCTRCWSKYFWILNKIALCSDSYKNSIFIIKDFTVSNNEWTIISMLCAACWYLLWRMMSKESP